MISRRELPLACGVLLARRSQAAAQGQTPESLVWSDETIAWQPVG